jgi:putative resolvase
VLELRVGVVTVDPLLPIGEAARLIGVSVDTLRTWEADGRIEATRSAGGQRRFSLVEVERLIEERAS